MHYEGDRRELLKFIPSPAKKILDVGCSSGNFGALLKKNLNAAVTGIELREDAAREAAGKLDRVILGDVESSIDQLQTEEFDCIIFADILEHLYDPAKILTRYRRCLKKGGILLCSIPNIAHISILAQLIFHAEWRYEDSGILDRTHVRFFTRKSFRRLLAETGFQVQNIKSIFSLKGSKYLDILTLGLMRDFFTAQYIFTAQY